MEKALPPIPAKRYFTIGEVSELCAVKPYVLRYWEQEFTQLKPMKRRGNRRYYQHHEVLLIRRIRELLYDHGFTISGARNRLADGVPGRVSDADFGADQSDERIEGSRAEQLLDGVDAAPSASPALSIPERAVAVLGDAAAHAAIAATATATASVAAMGGPQSRDEVWATAQVRAELMSIRDLLSA
jgi:DNA-binding transcriptional MerR regulator